MAIKVLIVDDHPAVREGLAVWIDNEPDLEVCGQAADEEEAMKLAAAIHPDVMVVDIQLGTGNGLDLVQRVKALDGSIRFLVCSMFADSTYARRALQAGALGYINKRQATSQIVKAIRHVRDGRLFVSEETGARLLSMDARGRSEKTTGAERLSDRELEVYRLIGQGLSSSEVAKRLHRSVHTVEAHRGNIKKKLALKSAGELTRAAVRWVLENG